MFCGSGFSVPSMLGCRVFIVVATLRNSGLLVKSGGHHGGRYDVNYHFPLELASELYEFLNAKYKNPEGCRWKMSPKLLR